MSVVDFSVSAVDFRVFVVDFRVFVVDCAVDSRVSAVDYMSVSVVDCTFSPASALDGIRS